jgi:protein SCO1
MRRTWFLLILGGMIGILLISAIALKQPYQLRGSLIDPPARAPDIRLMSTKGGDFDVSAEGGKILLVFFGFTNCTDVCPATMNEMRKVAESLGSLSQNVEVIFVTVDPKRDNLERLKGYVEGFNPSFIGLTDQESKLSEVWESYGVAREIDGSENSNNYSVTHSTRIYLIDRQGNLRLTYTLGTPADDIEHDIRNLLKES